MTKVAIILPSRGLIYSQTADEILQNLSLTMGQIPHRFFFSHKKPIPECFERPTNLALLDDSITHLWFVEDDMALPQSTLRELLDLDVAVATADYPVNKDGRGSVFEVKGRILFTGTGCLLVKREVFDELKAPYFRTDIRWRIKRTTDGVKVIGNKVKDTDGYGLHDVNFGINLFRRDIPIHKIDTKLGQRKLVALGKAGTNEGAHNIETWAKITKDHLLKQIKKWPIEPTGDLVEIKTPTGIVNVTHSHAKTLVRKKLGERLPKRPIIIDDSEVL